MREVAVDCLGMQCPGPIVKLFQASKECSAGDVLVASSTDPGFSRDVEAWCSRTGNKLLSILEQDGVVIARIEKA
ncbi:MAG: sulfurtransferase TusA family protein [Bacillota bacterium]